jgi:hypothetical protein
MGVSGVGAELVNKRIIGGYVLTVKEKRNELCVLVSWW